MNPEAARKASSFWDQNVKMHEKTAIPISWLDSPVIAQHCLKKLPAGEKCISVISWIQWVKERFAPGSVFDYGLSLGCGDGTLERHALALNICSRFDAFDISPKSIEAAKGQSAEQGLDDRVNYHVADLNAITLEPDKYDIIFSGMALHHIANLEHVFSMLQKSLKPDGLFVLIEFVGPSQFQWTEKQVTIINEILELLPPRLKIDARFGELKKQFLRPTIESMNAGDPSEAIRSSDILPLVYKMWNVEEHIDFGGTISHMLLDGIISNFSGSQEDVTILKLIEYLDDVLIREGVLQSDFTIIAARNQAPEHKNNKSGIFGKRHPFMRQPPVNKGYLLRKFFTSLKENGKRETIIKTLLYIRNRMLPANRG